MTCNCHWILFFLQENRALALNNKTNELMQGLISALCKSVLLHGWIGVIQRDVQVKWLGCTQDAAHKLEILLQTMVRIRSGAKLFSNGMFAPKWLILPEICLCCLSANLWWPYRQYLLCNSLIQEVLKSVQGFSFFLTVFCEALIWTCMGSLNYSLHLPTLKMWSRPPSIKKPSLVPAAGVFNVVSPTGNVTQ